MVLPLTKVRGPLAGEACSSSSLISALRKIVRLRPSGIKFREQTDPIG